MNHNLKPTSKSRNTKASLKLTSVNSTSEVFLIECIIANILHTKKELLLAWDSFNIMNNNKRRIKHIEKIF